MPIPSRLDISGIARVALRSAACGLSLGCLALAGCSLSPARRAETPAALTAPAPLMTGGGMLASWPAGLPSPGALARALATVPPERLRTGADYSTGLPSNLISTEDTQAVLTPAWPVAGGHLSQAAYACYLFNLPGYTGAATAQVRFQDALPAGASAWLGCADWPGQAWRWMPLSAGLDCNALLPPLSRSLRGDGALLLAVVLLSPAGTPARINAVLVGPEGELPAADVTFSVDAGAAGTPISPYVYGTNGLPTGSTARPSFSRSGGNRWTAYNWENNASNAGSDWYHQNDGYLGESNEPGWSIRTFVERAQAEDAAALVTVPLAGYVAADKLGGGDVNQTPNYLEVRFRQNRPRKGAALAYPPDITDAYVYQDEFASWLNTNFAGAAGGASPSIFFSLDNEPDLWSSTHARIHPDNVSYSELVDRTVALAAALKDAVPGAVVFGPVSYGWYGYVTLQDAPDAGEHGDFLDYYLDQLQQANQAAGRRLLDVLDVHWYPEAQGGGVRITESDSSPAVVAARLQAPRSLWDGTYTEDSWIAQWGTGGPIYLIPRLQAKIAEHYPETKLAITEYCYGAGDHISGGLATADALGVYGRTGVFAASIWPLQEDNSYTWGALALYTNYDGAGGRFGATSLPLANPDVESYSAYAARQSVGGALTLVLINKLDTARIARVRLENAGETYSQAEAYVITAGQPEPVRGADIALQGLEFNAALPASSATLLRVR